MNSPTLEFYPESGMFRLYPDDRLRLEHGARSFRIDPGDFQNADTFNVRSSAAQWPEFDADGFFAFRQHVLTNIAIEPDPNVLELNDLHLKLAQCLVAMAGADALDGVDDLRRLQKVAEVYR